MRRRRVMTGAHSRIVVGTDAASSSTVVVDSRLTKSKRKVTSEVEVEAAAEDSAMIKMAIAIQTPARILIKARDEEEGRETSVTSKMAKGRRNKSANAAESAIDKLKRRCCNRTSSNNWLPRWIR